MSLKNRREFLRFTATAATLPLLASTVAADGHATEHTVIIRGFTFEPADLTINAGDKVMFMNEDSAPHTATADNGSFDTNRLNKGQSATLTFETAGTYTYFCAIHPHMKGSITVS